MNEDCRRHADPLETPIFDRKMLAELELLFGRQRLMELLGVLDHEIAIRLDTPATEPSQLARDAHILVSSSGALAFLTLSDACSALEQACVRGEEVSLRLDSAVLAARDARDAIATLRAA
ncbi:Hpt domain-containing protein [Methylorubrum populi]